MIPHFHRAVCDLRPVGKSLGLKSGKAQNEQMFSGLPPTADLPPDLRTTPAASSSRMLPSRPRAPTGRVLVLSNHLAMIAARAYSIRSIVHLLKSLPMRIAHAGASPSLTSNCATP